MLYITCDKQLKDNGNYCVTFHSGKADAVHLSFALIKGGPERQKHYYPDDDKKDAYKEIGAKNELVSQFIFTRNLQIIP